jgi:hypothetical protein
MLPSGWQGAKIESLANENALVLARKPVPVSAFFNLNCRAMQRRVHTISQLFHKARATFTGLLAIDAGRRAGRERIRLRWNLCLRNGFILQIHAAKPI